MRDFACGECCPYSGRAGGGPATGCSSWPEFALLVEPFEEPQPGDARTRKGRVTTFTRNQRYVAELLRKAHTTSDIAREAPPDAR